MQALIAGAAPAEPEAEGIGEPEEREERPPPSLVKLVFRTVLLFPAWVLVSLVRLLQAARLYALRQRQKKREAAESDPSRQDEGQADPITSEAGSDE